MFLDAISLLLSKASFIGLRLIVLLIFSMILDKERFGGVSLAFMTADIARFIADWGVDTWSLRKFSNPNIVLAKYQFQILFRIRVVAAFVSIIISFLAISHLGVSLSSNEIILISCLSFTSLWINMGVNWLQARHDLRSYAIVLLMGCAFCMLILYYVYSINGLPELYLEAVLGFEVLVSITLIYKIIKSNWPFEKIEKYNFWSVLKETTPIAVAILIALVYGRVDIYFVNNYLSPTYLADYGFASRVVEPIVFMAAALSSTLYARASMVFQSEAKNSQNFYVFAYSKIKLNGLAAFALCLLCAMLAPYIIELHFEKYKTSVPVLMVLLVVTAFRCLNLTLTAVIQAAGGYGIMMKLSFFNSITTLVFVILGGIAYKTIGVACAIGLAEFINSVVQIFFLKKLIRIKS